MTKHLSQGVIHALVLPVLFITSNTVYADDPLVPCEDGYVYVCVGIMCGCARKSPIRIRRRAARKAAVPVAPNTTVVLAATLGPNGETRSECETNLTLEVFDASGTLLRTRTAMLSSHSPSAVFEEEIASGSSPVLRTFQVTDAPTGCTIEESLAYAVTVYTYVTATGQILSQTSVPTIYQLPLDPGTLPPVYPPYPFPPGLSLNKSTVN
jgi:hypothetical protein